MSSKQKDKDSTVTKIAKGVGYTVGILGATGSVAAAYEGSNLSKEKMDVNRSGPPKPPKP